MITFLLLSGMVAYATGQLVDIPEYISALVSGYDTLAERDLTARYVLRTFHNVYAPLHDPILESTLEERIRTKKLVTEDDIALFKHQRLLAEKGVAGYNARVHEVMTHMEAHRKKTVLWGTFTIGMGGLICLALPAATRTAVAIITG
jgi:hypothetical protein